MSSSTGAATSTGGVDVKPSWAAYYALGVVTLANVFNYLDRNIVSILGEHIKRDLKLDDAQLGFLLGTAFAVFFSTIGLAMGALADRLSRKRLMAFGVTLWSGMTLLGGFANSFLTLSIARFGVGIGEASTSPAAHSLLPQLFPKRNWSVVLAIFISGVFIGGTAAMVLGGVFLQYWHGPLCQAVPIADACSIASWKAALIAVGSPGLLVAGLILTIREPQRAPTKVGAGRTIAAEAAAVVPIVSLIAIYRLGGAPAAFNNLAIAAFVALAAGALAWLSGDVMQWAALGLGCYIVATWAQLFGWRDRVFFALTFGDRTFQLTVVAITLIGCVTGTLSFWTAPYAMRTYHLTPMQIGGSLAMVHLAGALIGGYLGAWLIDRWRLTSQLAAVRAGLIVIACLVPAVLVMLTIQDFAIFLTAYFFIAGLSGLHVGGFHALIQELVLSRMRATAAAAQGLISSLVIFGTGPYWAGKVSAVTGSLSAGLISILLLFPCAVIVLWALAKRLRTLSPESRIAIATGAGEPANSAMA